MISKRLDEICFDDFQSLIDNGVPEGRTIEYKESLNLKADKDKKEFLFDVSSFANAGGGDLICGVSESKETKLPEKIVGLDIERVDDAILQIDSLIRDGIKPRPYIQIRSFDTPDGKKLFLVRIPKSWNSPHHVTLQGANKFYTRGANGKYQMDVGELRTAFLFNETFAASTRSFVSDRIAMIVSETTPFQLLPYGKIALHLVPISSFALLKTYNISLEQPFLHKIELLNNTSRTPQYNVDGIISSSMNTSKGLHNGYVQLFRNGIIESVNADLMEPFGNQYLIPTTSNADFEKLIIEALQNYMTIYYALQVDLPVFLFVSLIEVKGYIIGSDKIRPILGHNGIPKEVLTLPEVEISNFDVNFPKLLKPLFDIIWNACGYPHSYHYDEKGDWKSRI